MLSMPSGELMARSSAALCLQIFSVQEGRRERHNDQARYCCSNILKNLPDHEFYPGKILSVDTRRHASLLLGPADSR
jgi:hypothetical protein